MPQVQTKDSYNYYIEKNNTKVSYKAYRNIIETLNFKVTEEIIKGKTFDFPYRLGQMFCVRANKNFKISNSGKPIMLIDYGNTKKLRKEGKLDSDKFVYFTAPEYSFIKWNFKGIRVSGFAGYIFKPCRTNGVECKTGFMNRFYAFVNENDTNSLIYPKLTNLIKSKK